MRIEIYLTSEERKFIRKALKHTPLFAAWKRSQAYLWTCVRSQKTCKQKTYYPDVRWTFSFTKSKYTSKDYWCMRIARWACDNVHSVAKASNICVLEISKNIWIPIPHRVFDEIRSESNARYFWQFCQEGE
jgi:hypothetical protein